MAQQSATDAERAASVRSASCIECDRPLSRNHAPDCVLRPVVRYEDYLRDLRANNPARYWGGAEEYLTEDHQ